MIYNDDLVDSNIDGDYVNIRSIKERKMGNTILMSSPNFFEINYAINSHMLDQNDNYHTIDLNLAKKQWDKLKYLYRTLGYDVKVIGGVKGLPDMVFSANQSFPYVVSDENGVFEKRVIMSNMKTNERKHEPEYFKQFYLDEGYKIEELSDKLSFESHGDAIWQPRRNLLWGGYGFRTDKEVYDVISEKVGCDVIPIELVDDRFYHLDICFNPLNEDSVVIYDKAFTFKGLDVIENTFEDVIRVSEEEALNLACNFYCSRDLDVVIGNGNNGLVKELLRRDYAVHVMDLSEFKKAGGSVFCMKNLIYGKEISNNFFI